MNRIYEELTETQRRDEEKAEFLPYDAVAMQEAIQRTLEEPGVKEVRIFRIGDSRRRFPIPPKNLRK